MMKKRYERNMSMLTAEENRQLGSFHVFVAGCGGLGGYVIECLGRMGIGHLTVMDGDIFDESNLNRQLLSDETVLSRSKAEVAKMRMEKVNSQISVQAIHGFLTDENCQDFIGGHDIVIDALDNIRSRRILEKAAGVRGIPLIHGAIAGWYGQISVILPGMKAFDAIYPQNQGRQEEDGMERELGNPSFTPAVVGAIQASEAIKMLLGKDGVLAGRLLTIDLLTHEYEIFELGQ